MKHKIDFTPKKKNKSHSTISEKLFLASALLFTFFILTMNTQENLGSSVATTSLDQGLSFFSKLKNIDFTPSLTGASIIEPASISIQAIVTDCSTINTPGPYLLTQNIGTGSYCINITTSHVLLDCQNYNITYGGHSPGNGIDFQGEIGNITIKNCHFFQNISLAGEGNIGVSISLGGSYFNNTIYNNTFYTQTDKGTIIIRGANNTNISWNSFQHNCGVFSQNSSVLDIQDMYNGYIDNNIINTSCGGGQAISYTQNSYQYQNASIRGNIVNVSGPSSTAFSLTGFTTGTIISDNQIVVQGNASVAVSIKTSSDLQVRSNILKATHRDASTAINLNMGFGTFSVNNSLFDNNTIATSGSLSPLGFGASNGALRIGTNILNNVFVNNNISAPEGIWEIYESGDTNVNYLIYNNTFGEIAWQNNGTGSFLLNLTLFVNGSLALGESVYIDNNTAALNTSVFTPVQMINSSANITLRSIGLPSVGQIHKVGNFTTNSTEIRHAGTDCNATGGCSIIFYLFGTIQFNTTGFSSFAANLSVAAASTSNCSTITTTTTLLNNINSVGTCITIGASHLTLNCANYLINYSQIGEAGFGINVTGYNNISIKNCIIREASVNTTGEYAIALVNAANITISNSTIQTVSSISTGIYASNTFVMNLSSNVISTNGSSAHAIYLVNSDNATISSNLINTSNPNANAYGINLDTTGNNTIVFNVINSSSTSLYISDKSNNNISYNNFTSSGPAGGGVFSLITVNSNKIHFNQINSTGASVYGIYTNPPSHNIFGENIIRTKDTTSDNNAYFFRTSDNNTITKDNIAASVSSNQIRLQDSNITLINLTFNKYNISFDEATSGTLTVQWNVYVNVSNNTGSALTNANVTIFNVSSLLEQSEQTGIDGTITFTLTEFRQTSSGKTFSSPHTINTTNSTYIANSTTINISNSNSTFQNIVLSFDTAPPRFDPHPTNQN